MYLKNYGITKKYKEPILSYNMKFAKEEIIDLDRLSTRASKLLVRIAEEDLSKEETPTVLDIKYKNTIFAINKISPMIANGYMKNYNEIQRQKIGDNSLYLKYLRLNTEYIKVINPIN